MTTHENKIGDIAVTKRQLNEEVTLEWKIKDFFSLFNKTDCKYKSPLFCFADMCLCMSLLPNGKSHNKSSESVGLYICREDSGPPKTFLYRFAIKKRNGEYYEKKGEMELNPEVFGRGEPEFCGRSWLQKRSHFNQGNALTIRIVLTSIIPTLTKGADEFLKSMRNLLKSGESSDFTIKVQDKEFPVHRLILGASSDVFKSMFTLDMIEKNEGVVTIADCDSEVFPDFLEYIYTGSTDISAKNVVSLYTVSDKYGVSSLKEECSEFIRRTLTVATFCDVIKLALKHDGKELLKIATDFFCMNSLAIVKTAKWQKFLKENATEGNELFIKMLSKNQGTSSEISVPPSKKRKTDTS